MGGCCAKVRAQRWTHHHLTVYLLTFFGYALIHANRKAFSTVKKSMLDVWSPPDDSCSDASDHGSVVCTMALYNNTVLFRPNRTWQHNGYLFTTRVEAKYMQGLLDTIFMVAYSAGQYISGSLGDRYDRRILLTIGMCSSGICTFVFGAVTEWLHFYNTAFYIIVWSLNGLCQALAWPVVVAIMANWFGKSMRGFILGLWGICSFTGSILGALLASAVLRYGYEYVFIVTSTLLVAASIVTFFGLLTHPSEVGLDSPDEMIENVATSGNDTKHNNVSSPPDQAMPCSQVWCLPGVVPYSLAFAAVKMVHYSFFFWLPLYLSQTWTEEVADRVSIWYDVGAIVATLICGIISDIIGMRSPVLICMLLMAAPSLYVYTRAPPDIILNSIFLANIGMWVGGPATLISSCIVTDIGQRASVASNQQAIAMVSGIVDGTGSFGSALGQIFVPILQVAHGWHTVFYLFIVMMLTSAVCVLPALRNDIAHICKRASSANSDDPAPDTAGDERDTLLEEVDMDVRDSTLRNPQTSPVVTETV